MFATILNRPRIKFQLKFLQWLYEDNPRFTGIPTVEELDNANYDLAYKKYKERFDNANDFHFYFVGNIDKAQLKQYVKQYLASLPSSDETETYQTFDYRPRHGDDKKVVKVGKAQKSLVQMIYQGPTNYSKEEELAMDALGEILSIRLIERIREQEGGAYTVSASGGLQDFPYDWYRMRIVFPCGPKHVQHLIDETKQVVQDIVMNGPKKENLHKVQEILTTDHKENMKENKYWLNALENTDQYGRNPYRMLDYNDRVNSLTTDEIHQVAQKYMGDGEFLLAIKNPAEKKK